MGMIISNKIWILNNRFESPQYSDRNSYKKNFNSRQINKGGGEYYFIILMKEINATRPINICETFLYVIL